MKYTMLYEIRRMNNENYTLQGWKTRDKII